MNPVELIERKRDGGALDLEEYRAFVAGYLAGDGSVMEGQMGAFLMAGVLKGFSTDEARALTTVLLESGEQLDLSALRGPTVDKHSTGGVGDGTTLIVVPLLAAAGVQVVKLSGRGLGHTGGTLDKLEAIPGLRVALDVEEMLDQTERIGCVVAAQTARIVPGDKALYALRDVTGTVSSMGLIASSVMSKKLASGAGSIVLDVKAGQGGLMGELAGARALAELCVDIGTQAGRRTRALVTDMNTPLGTGIGNALEVIEVVEQLQSRPAGRFAEVCLQVAAHALALATDSDVDAARDTVVRRWEDGSGLEALRALVAAQGGDPAVCDDPRRVLAAAPVVRPVLARTDGVLTRLPARETGLVANQLGAGRQHAGDAIDPAVGVELHVREGDAVTSGQSLATVHARTEADADVAGARMLELLQIGADGTPAPTVLDVIG